MDDAVTSGDPDGIWLVQAMWQQAATDDERRWVGELLQEYLHLSPHRTPRLVVEAAEASEALRAALALVRVDSLPAKARGALERR